jgi:hypothetical protein
VTVKSLHLLEGANKDKIDELVLKDLNAIETATDRGAARAKLLEDLNNLPKLIPGTTEEDIHQAARYVNVLEMNQTVRTGLLPYVYLDITEYDYTESGKDKKHWSMRVNPSLHIPDSGTPLIQADTNRYLHMQNANKCFIEAYQNNPAEKVTSMKGRCN